MQVSEHSFFIKIHSINCHLFLTETFGKDGSYRSTITDLKATLPFRVNV